MQPVPEVSPALRARLQKCFEYGNQKMQLRDYDYATEMFSQCVKGDPANLLYMNSLIVNLRYKFGEKKAKKSFLVRKVKATLPTKGKEKDLQTLISEGVDKLKRDPWDEQTFVSMGLACLDAGLDEAGLAYLKHAVESAPDDVEVNRLAAIEFGERHLFEQALFCWQRVSKLKPDDVEAGKRMSDLMLERTINRVNEANRNNDAENEKEEEPGEKLSVEDQCEKRLRKNPNDREAYLDLIEYFFQKGNLRKTEDSLKRALKVFPDDAVLYPRLLEVQKSRAAEQLTLLKAQYEKAPSDVIKEKYIAQKKAYDEKNLEYIQYRLQKSPGTSSLHWELGAFYMAQGKFKEAITELQTAKIDPAIAGQCLLALAQCFQQIKQYRLAMSHYEQSVTKLQPQSDEIKKALYYGARLAYGLENYEKADDFANRLAAIDFSYKDVGGLLDKIAEKRHNKQ